MPVRPLQFNTAERRSSSPILGLFRSAHRWNYRLLIAVLLLSLASFAIASLLPVYTDEITWSAILGRINYDRGRSLTITLQPTCEGFYARAVSPVLWWSR